MGIGTESPKKSYWGQVGRSFTEMGQKVKKKRVTVVRYKKIKETSNLIIDLPKLVSDGGV